MNRQPSSSFKPGVLYYWVDDRGERRALRVISRGSAYGKVSIGFRLRGDSRDVVRKTVAGKYMGVEYIAPDMYQHAHCWASSATATGNHEG